MTTEAIEDQRREIYEIAEAIAPTWERRRARSRRFRPRSASGCCASSPRGPAPRCWSSPRASATPASTRPRS